MLLLHRGEREKKVAASLSSLSGNRLSKGNSRKLKQLCIAEISLEIYPLTLLADTSFGRDRQISIAAVISPVWLT